MCIYCMPLYQFFIYEMLWLLLFFFLEIIGLINPIRLSNNNDYHVVLFYTGASIFLLNFIYFHLRLKYDQSFYNKISSDFHREFDID